MSSSPYTPPSPEHPGEQGSKSSPELGMAPSLHSVPNSDSRTPPQTEVPETPCPSPQRASPAPTASNRSMDLLLPHVLGSAMPVTTRADLSPVATAIKPDMPPILPSGSADFMAMIDGEGSDEYVTSPSRRFENARNQSIDFEERLTNLENHTTELENRLGFPQGAEGCRRIGTGAAQRLIDLEIRVARLRHIVDTTSQVGQERQDDREGGERENDE